MPKNLMPSQETPGFLHVTLIRSRIGRHPDQINLLNTLGLKKVHSQVERPNSVSVRSVVNQVRHLVLCEHVEQVCLGGDRMSEGRMNGKRDHLLKARDTSTFCFFNILV
jgi:large subunit ribosomal protein L30